MCVTVQRCLTPRVLKSSSRWEVSLMCMSSRCGGSAVTVHAAAALGVLVWTGPTPRTGPSPTGVQQPSPVPVPRVGRGVSSLCLLSLYNL